MQSKPGGFTLIEVLVAMSLFAIIMVFTTQALMSNLKVSQQSDTRANQYTQLLDFAEDLRRQWLDPTAFSPGLDTGTYRLNRACYDSSLVIPSGYTVTVYDVTANLDDTYTVSAGYSLSPSCATATYRPDGTARRVRIQTGTVNGQRAETTFTLSGTAGL